MKLNLRINPEASTGEKCETCGKPLAPENLYTRRIGGPGIGPQLQGVPGSCREFRDLRNSTAAGSSGALHQENRRAGPLLLLLPLC